MARNDLMGQDIDIVDVLWHVQKLLALLLSSSLYFNCVAMYTHSVSLSLAGGRTREREREREYL